MIKRCIVSAFTRLRRNAVLKPQFNRSLKKDWVVFTALFAPALANAQFTYTNWYGANDVSITAMNECKSVYKISYKSGRDAQLALYKDGVNLNSSNTHLADDVEGFTWKKGERDNIYALHRTAGEDSENTTFYYIAGLLKDTLSTIAPTYTTVGISGVGYQKMSLSSTPSFSATFCGVGAATQPADAQFQWQAYTDDTKIWVNIDGATDAEFTAAAGQLADSTFVRVQMTTGGKAIVSSSLLTYYDEPGIDVLIKGTEVFETVQRPKYENEIDYGQSFNLTADALGASKIKGGYKLYTRSDNEEKWTLFKEVADESPVTITPTQNLEYKIVAECEDMRPGHEGETIKGEETFFVRVRFSWDKGAKVDTLFFDNFGVFPASNEYTTFEGESFANELTTMGGDAFKIEKYWAPDYYESVKNHTYAHLNELVGPFGGDCAEDDYKHYVCWDNGGCDGYRIEDGYYAIVPNPDYSNCGRSTKDYWNGYDHTDPSGATLGGMLFVNCEKGSEKTVLFEREITLKNDCENTRLLFSAFVNNATAVWDNKPVNVRLIIRDSEDKVIFETPSGNIYPRTLKGGLWANLSFMFSAAKGGKYKVQLVNNQAGGAADAGNDLLFDDILIIAAYPTVDVFRNREKTDATPVDTCAEVTVPLFLLNKDDIKKYITSPKYLYQYSKDSITWVNIGQICEDDSFLVDLNKKNEIYWDTTYFRGIVASNEKVIDNILKGNAPELSCDSVYAVSAPFKVVFDYSGPVDAEIVDTLCAGDTYKVELSTYGRPKYRVVDSYTGEVIDNMDTNFSYTLKVEDPQDTTFLYILEQRLGCTDTVKIKIHRRLYVDFTTPDPFVTCLYETSAKLTNIFPETGASFIWSSGDFVSLPNAGSVIIPASLPKKGEMTVKGSAKDFCETSKTFKYDIHDSVKVTLKDLRGDSLFCLSGADASYQLTAVTTQGEPATYYWIKNGVQVGQTVAPTNTFSFGELTEGNHSFGVKVADEVCNKTEDNTEFKVELPISVREPISIELTADKNVCENLKANAEVELKHVLKADTTTVRWSVTSGNASVENAATFADASMRSANKVIPTFPAALPTTEKIALKASVFDRVCTSNNPEATASIDMYKVLNLTVAADSHDGLFCMKTDDAKITLTATVTRGEVGTYEWYDGVGGMESTTGAVPTHSFLVGTEGTHTYVVKSSDGVCSKAGVSDSVFTFPTQVRRPVVMELDVDPAVCENATANAKVSLKHLLNPAGSNVAWAVTSGNGSMEADLTLTLANQTSANKFVPASTTNTTELVSIMAKVIDEVCLDNVVEKTASLKLYKPIEVKISTDRTDGLFCMTEPVINFSVETIKGEVKTYYWFDGDILVATDDKNTHTFPVSTEGKHIYKVLVVDSVCNRPMGSEASASATIESRLPVVGGISADEVVCEGVTVPVSASFQHLLADGAMVAWQTSANASLDNNNTFTANAASSVVLSTVPTTTHVEEVIVKAGVLDDVCRAAGDLYWTEPFSIKVHKKVDISLAADGIVNNNLCLSTEGANEVGLTVTVNRGDPDSYVWSDGATTEDPKHSIAIHEGSNIFFVMAIDPVCDASGATTYTQDSIEARFPLEMQLIMTAGKNPACMGEAVSLAAVVTDPNNLGDDIVYVWTGEKSTTASATYNSVTDFKSGNNPVYASVIADNRICPAITRDVNISVQDSVVISLDVPSSLCQMQDSTEEITLVVNVLAGNPQGYKWSTGDVTVQPSLNVRPTATTLYSVQALDEVCSNSIVVAAAHPVEVSSMFTLQVSAVSHEVQMGTAAQLQSVILEDANSTKNVVWIRVDQYGASSEVGTVPVGPFENVINENGSYEFYAVADGGHCGVISSDKLTIDVADFYQVPTAFTPYNANPKNNIFMKGYAVEIFNRYQQMVYEGPDGWDGMYKGQLAEPGTYFYRLVKKDGRVLKGTIELVKF